MASQYLQQLDAITSTLGTYLIPISDDPSGTGRLKKITFTNLLGGTLGSAAYTASSAYDAAGAAAAVVSDIAYDATSWNGVTGIAPSKNAVRDYLNTLGTAAFVNIGTDTTLAANSDSIVATQKATKTYVDTMVTGLLEFKGSVDCSANPNYSSANKGDAYYVNVAGKIGGASGESVEVGDVIVASADNAGGTEASVGTSWFVMEHNLVGAAVTSGTLAQFAATTSAQLAGVISDETGSGSLVFSNSPTLITPILGVASATSLAITGTSGAGYLSLIGQASTPAEPAAGTMLIYSETEQGFTRLRQHNEEITNLILGQDNAFVVRNTSGASIAKGSAVYITGSTGHTPNVSKAQANSSVTTPAVGILVDAIADNAYGQAMFTGVLSGINTSTLVSGEPVFLSTTVAGGVTTTRPSGTTNIVQAIGTVLVVGVGNGEIKVAIAPALLNSETGTNAATWTGRAVVATSFNGLTLSSTTGTITLTNGKTLSVSNTLTFAGTDSSTLNIGTGGTLGTAAYTASSAYEVPLTFSTGLTRTVNSIVVNSSQSIATLSNLTSNGIVTTSGGVGTLSVTATTGSNSVVLSTSPTLVTPVLGVASATGLTVTNTAAMARFKTGSAADGRVEFAYNITDIAYINIASASLLDITARSGVSLAFGANGSEAIRIDTSKNVGIGTTSPSARVHAISTTEQLRLGYDSSNYLSTTVSSAGAVNFAAVGASAAFAFNAPVSVSDGFIAGNIILYSSTVSVPTATNVTINVRASTSTMATGYCYRVRLNTAGTGTVTGAVYIINQTAATPTWVATAVSVAGSTSNHPLLLVSGSSIQVYHNHGSTYLVSYVVETIAHNNGTVNAATIWGADSLFTGTDSTSITTASGYALGVGTLPSAKIHAVSTTEQLRLGYDASNYYSTTVSSAGEVTFDSVGASSSFTFSDVITLSVATPLISFKPTVNTQDCGLKILNAAGSAAGYLSIVPNTIGTNSKFLMYVGGAAAADIKLTVDDDGVTNIKRDASNYVTITPSSVGLITFDAVGSGAAFSFSDSVAIGVATPLYPLHVNLSSGDNQLYVSSGTPSSVAGDSYLTLNSSRTDTGVGHICKISSVAVATGKADLAFLTQPSNGVYTERMRIDNAGYVGIGTTAPTSALSVVGVVKMEASSQRRPALTSSNFGYSANYRTLMLGSSSTTYNTADTGAVTLAFGVDVSANAGGTFTGDGSELLFRNVVHFITPNSGNTNYQKVLSLNNGNVGIGTTSPQSKLQVTATETVASAGVVQIGGGASAAYGVLVDYAALNSGRCSITQLNDSGGSAATIALGFGAVSAGFPANNVLTLNQSGNAGLGVIAFGTSATKVLGIGNGTEPTTSPADMVQLYSVDLSAGNATLGLRTETAVVTESVTSNRTLSIRINGTTYKLCLKA